MVFKSRIKWIALFVLILSMGSLVVHLSITKSSGVQLAYSARDNLWQDFDSLLGAQDFRNKHLWRPVKSLETLQPYANPRNSYPAPSSTNNRFIYAKIFGGFDKIRSSICDLVTISRLLNATLVIPELQESLRSKGISNKFKSFSYLYDEEQFIAFLKNDVIVTKTLPESLKAARKRNEFPLFKPKNSASPKFYLEDVLPKLKKANVIGLIVSDGGCLQSTLPASMPELQRLRCRVAFHALQLRSEIQVLGKKMVDRLRKSGQPFLAYHPGLVREKLAYHGCAELFQDIHSELIQYRRAQMIKQKFILEELIVDSRLRRDNGLCPLMPEEVGILLKALGYSQKAIIYLAGSEMFGGQRVLIPLRAMFPNLVDRTSLCSTDELSELVGPETPLPENTFKMPPRKSDKQLKEEWNKAGPRPRPLPPPPDRPIYQHEKEGWYGWLTENDTEPSPSPMDLRNQAHRLLWDALDFAVSVEADVFFPGFNNDGSGWPDFSSLVMGQRLYERPSSRTYRLDRKVIQELFNITREDMYHPNRNWTLRVRKHLNSSLGESGLIRQSMLSKPRSFLSHPLPECSCRTSALEDSRQLRSDDGRFLYGGEDECPKWIKSAGVEKSKTDDGDQPDYEHDLLAEQSETEEEFAKSKVASAFDQDEEWDPND
ncbi:GDP-fucose protein O-fucosyltransferase [Arabidopsis thaliana x Arabidopsis arenosa]|uniref:O-fucosyltransferase family protein n=1 Tax=Arabidopsis thaliana x Arabidopsis arenosa TaxID=1240361 RepID=A0A8T2AP29_9BRAS|nr:GDP-fucose protein O-fucosyltransferase [Arabidopsis thaliana x Arabidopsis arenosa]